jgi:hypothetical protein
MSACVRQHEVEEARDGLRALDAVHVAGCAACQAEQAALEALSGRLGALHETPVDEAALARAREAVLAQAFAPGRTVRWERLAIAAGVVFCVAAGAALSLKLMVPPSQTRIQAIDEGSARWTLDSRDDSERIVLADGTLQLSVTRPASGKKVIVQVPDGTIEDIGTVFHVVVDHGTTKEVRVDQGAVRLTLASVGVVELRAGERWSRDAVKPAVGATEAHGEVQPPPPAITQPEPTLAPAEAPAPVVAPQHATSPRPPAPTVAHPAPVTVQAQGSVGSDEDAAYLEIVKLMREGAQQEARAAAQRYLERFPEGFRAREVHDLIR